MSEELFRNGKVGIVGAALSRAEGGLAATLETQWEVTFSTVPMPNRMPYAIHSGRPRSPRGHQ